MNNEKQTRFSRLVSSRLVSSRLVSSRLVFFLLLLTNAFGVFGQSNPWKKPLGSTGVAYSDLYLPGSQCLSHPIIYGSRASVGSLSFDYSITSTGDQSAPAFRTLNYEYWRQDPAGNETREATTFIDGGSLGLNRTIRYGGISNIPLTLPSGSYRVRLVANYQFASPPINSDTRLTVKVNKGAGAGNITLYDQFSPPQYPPEVIIDDNFACFDFIACQKIADNLTVNNTQDGDFIFATVTPQDSYQYIWTTLAYVANAPGAGSTTPMPTFADNSTKPFCVNVPIRLTTIASNGCKTEKIFAYDGTFHPNVEYGEHRTDIKMCLPNRSHYDNYQRIGNLGGNQSQIDRIKTVIREFGDGSSQESVQNYQTSFSGLFPFFELGHQYPPQTPAVYYGWYQFVSTNGCVSPMTYLEKSLPDVCGGPALDDSQEETTISPNPVSGALNIKLKTDQSLESVEILNVAGKVIYNEKANGETTKQIDMSSFNSGIYFIKVRNTEGVQKIAKIFKN